MSKVKLTLVSILVVGMLLLTACSQPDAETGAEKLKVVATTTIVADVVDNVGGDLIELSTLLPVGTDPHSFEPSPQDIAKVADADVVFANGAGLEAFLDNLLESADATGKIVEVSDGIEFIEAGADQHHDDEDAEAGEHVDEDSEEGGHEHSVDPHTWIDPNNVMVWVNNISEALVERDPHNADSYQKNADAYLSVLTDMDAWIREQVSMIPESNRKIVTDHALFGYFIRSYGFEQVGAVVPGYSSMAEPTAKELAQLEDAINALEIKAVFVGNTVNASLSERVTEDTGTTLVFIYTGSLSDADGPAATYEDYIRYNVNSIVDALK